MASRIYLVTHQNERYLVEASTNAQAVGYISQRSITARVPTQQELVSMVTQGLKVEMAKPANLELDLEGGN